MDDDENSEWEDFRKCVEDLSWPQFCRVTTAIMPQVKNEFAEADNPAARFHKFMKQANVVSITPLDVEKVLQGLFGFKGRKHRSPAYSCLWSKDQIDWLMSQFPPQQGTEPTGELV